MNNDEISLDYVLECHPLGKNVSNWISLFHSHDFQEHHLLPLSADLLRIGMGLYFLEVLGRYPNVFRIEAYEPSKIEQITSYLSIIFEELVGNRIEIIVTKKKEPSVNNINIPRGSFTSVCLFSGGLDSTAGVIDNVSENKNQILVNYNTSSNMYGKMKDRYKLITEELNHQTGKNITIPRFDITAAVASKRCKRSDNIFPNTRTLLFLFSAAAIALQTQVNKIQIFENGPMLLNPPFSSLANPTLGNRPEILYYVSKIFSNISNNEITLEIPFLTLTKQEIVSKVSNKLANETYSCSLYRRRKIHCGLCFSCFVRRLSILGSGYLEDSANYEKDALEYKNYPKSSGYNDKFNILLEFIDFCKRIINDENFEPEIQEVFKKGDLAFNINSYDLYKRFASQSINALKYYYTNSPESSGSLIYRKFF